MEIPRGFVVLEFFPQKLTSEFWDESRKRMKYDGLCSSMNNLLLSIITGGNEEALAALSDID